MSVKLRFSKARVSDICAMLRVDGEERAIQGYMNCILPGLPVCLSNDSDYKISLALCASVKLRFSKDRVSDICAMLRVDGEGMEGPYMTK